MLFLSLKLNGEIVCFGIAQNFLSITRIWHLHLITIFIIACRTVRARRKLKFHRCDGHRHRIDSNYSKHFTEFLRNDFNRMDPSISVSILLFGCIVCAPHDTQTGRTRKFHLDIYEMSLSRSRTHPHTQSLTLAHSTRNAENRSSQPKSLLCAMRAIRQMSSYIVSAVEWSRLGALLHSAHYIKRKSFYSWCKVLAQTLWLLLIPPCRRLGIFRVRIPCVVVKCFIDMHQIYSRYSQILCETVSTRCVRVRDDEISAKHLNEL